MSNMIRKFRRDAIGTKIGFVRHPIRGARLKRYEGKQTAELHKQPNYAFIHWYDSVTDLVNQMCVRETIVVCSKKTLNNCMKRAKEMGKKLSSYRVSTNKYAVKAAQINTFI